MEIPDADLVVIGSGAAGLTAAIVAKRRGLRVVVLEKDVHVGGTTAISGGVLWVPLTAHGQIQNPGDSAESVRVYLRHETGSRYSGDEVDLLLEKGPEMVEFFERETELRFSPTSYPDYHPDAPGGCAIGRAIVASPYDLRRLGAERIRLRPPLKTITFMGMMFNSSNSDLKHFFKATRSLRSFSYVVRRLTAHLVELVRYRRSVHVTGGNALAARLFKSAIDLEIPILTSTIATGLIAEGDGVVGVSGTSNGEHFQVIARAGVILACGGFSHDRSQAKLRFPQLGSGGRHVSVTPDSISGDGIRLALSVGGHMADPLPQPAAWMPISIVPWGRGEHAVFPHLLDRYKPGVIAVLRNGKRFTNESNSYHDVGAAAIESCRGDSEAAMWLVCDRTALARFGLGYVKPAPLPFRKHVKSGYLYAADSLSSLGRKMGIDGNELEKSVAAFNLGAKAGEDPMFRRGSTAFNRFLGDPDHKPNPCVAPIVTPPYFGLKLLVGDLGTFDGLRTDAYGKALRRNGSAIRGLYVLGADRVSMMGGAYPGPGINHGPHMTMAYVAANSIADSKAPVN